MSAIVSWCGLPDEHEPHWITTPPEGVLGGSTCLGHAAPPVDLTALGAPMSDDTESTETTMTLAPFTADDLSMRWDDNNHFPFVENDQCNITGYGHQDKAEFAAKVNRYDQHVGNIHPDDIEQQWTASDIAHKWAVRVDEETCRAVLDDSTHVDRDTPGAFPITTLWGQR